MKKVLSVVAVMVVLLAACGMDGERSAEDTNDRPGMDSAGDMGAMDEMEGVGELPAVKAFFDGEEVLFVHSEASDAQVADMLTEMMDSPVVVVPALADVPDSSLGNVFVFSNGVRPDGARGPMGFQPDVFDSAPTQRGYSPLRKVNLVMWADDADPLLLRSAAEIDEARRNAELSIEETDVVVNMPFLTWPGGHR